MSGAVVDQSVMGAFTDAKAALVECVSGGGTVKANGGNGLDLKAGVVPGFRWVNPDGGLDTLTISTAGAARFRVYLFV